VTPPSTPRRSSSGHAAARDQLDQLAFYWPDKLENIDRNLDRVLVDMLGLPPMEWPEL
jgi:hypothetical protein